MFIDTKGKGVTVWLVKFPAFITEKINECPNDLNVGSINVLKEDNGNVNFTFQLGEDLINAGLPTEYSIDFTESNSNMYILKSDHISANIEGSVAKECVVKPIINKEYIKYKRTISSTILKPVRTVQRISYKDLSNKENINDVESRKRKRKETQSENKRERLDREEVMNIIFNAYEKNTLWTVKDLADFSGQPVAYVQEIVSEICTMNKKDHRNTWELKAEYKFRGNR